MKSVAEHLRNLSKTHRDRVKAAEAVARNMKIAAEAAAKAKAEEETPGE